MRSLVRCNNFNCTYENAELFFSYFRSTGFFCKTKWKTCFHWQFSFANSSCVDVVPVIDPLFEWETRLQDVWCVHPKFIVCIPLFVVAKFHGFWMYNWKQHCLMDTKNAAKYAPHFKNLYGLCYKINLQRPNIWQSHTHNCAINCRAI